MSFTATTEKHIFVFFLLLTVFIFPKALYGNDRQVWFGLTDPDDVYSETLITFLPSATDTADVLFDAHRMTAVPGFDVYSKIGTADFKVQALPLLTGDKTVTLGIDAIVSGIYILRLDRFENIDESVAILLEDTLTGEVQNLRVEPLYAFYQDAAMDVQRFKIHFFAPFNFTATEITCAGNPGAVHLSQPGSYMWSYEIKDAANAVIDAGVAFNGVKTLDSLEGGIYTINLQDGYGYALTKQIELEAKSPVVAQFEVSEDNLLVGQTLHLYDYSTGASALAWNFGDGTIVSADAFPTHHFAQPGIYEVSLTASNDDCLQTFSKAIQINDVSMDVEDNLAERIRYYSDGKQLTVTVPHSVAAVQLQVYNLLGQKVHSENELPSGIHSLAISEKCDFCIVQIKANDLLLSGKVYFTK